MKNSPSWKIEIPIPEMIYKVKREVHNAQVLEEVGATLFYKKVFLRLIQTGANRFFLIIHSALRKMTICIVGTVPVQTKDLQRHELKLG